MRNNSFLLCVFTSLKYHRVVVISPLRGLLFPASYEASFLSWCSSRWVTHSSQTIHNSCFSFKFSAVCNLYLAMRCPTPNKGLHTGTIQRKAVFFGRLQWDVSALLPWVTLDLCRERRISRETKVNFTNHIHVQLSKKLEITKNVK